MGYSCQTVFGWVDHQKKTNNGYKKTPPM